MADLIPQALSNSLPSAVAEMNERVHYTLINYFKIDKKN